jgi:RsiW-degrading membrane proteinase PrsW (M82 family)
MRPPRREAREPVSAASTKEWFRSLASDVSSFSFSEILPLGRLLDPETLGKPVAWVLLLFGLGPLVIGSVVEDPLLRVRLFNFSCGALWTAFFVAAFKTERQLLKLGIAAFFATGVFGLLFVSVLQGVPPLSWIYLLLEPSRPFPVRVLAYIFGVGLLEELGKGLILVLLARVIGGLKDTADGVFYGLMSGLGFGVYEAIAYTEWVNPHQSHVLSVFAGSPTIGLYGYFVASVVRVVSLPLLHAVWTAIVGYFIGLSFSARRKTPAPLILGLLIAAVLHGLYDAFQSADSPLVALAVAAFSLLLFLSYRSTPPLLVESGRADGARAV